MDQLETRIPPVVWLVLSLVVVWGIAAVDRHWRFVVNGTAQLVAVALLLIGAGVVLDALGGFTREKTTVNPHKPGKSSAIVTKGVYRFTRNPMYLGMVFVCAALALFLSSLVALIVGPLLLALALTRFQIIPEERMLAQNFGDEYNAYRNRVRRWL